MSKTPAEESTQHSLPVNVIRRLMHSSGHRMALRENSNAITQLALEDLGCIIKSAVLHTFTKGTTRLNGSAVEFAMRENNVEVVDSASRKKVGRKQVTKPKQGTDEADEAEKADEAEEAEEVEEAEAAEDDDLDSF